MATLITEKQIITIFKSLKLDFQIHSNCFLYNPFLNRRAVTDIGYLQIYIKDNLFSVLNKIRQCNRNKYTGMGIWDDYEHD